MEIKTYQEKSARTMCHLSTPIMDELHMVLGMQTEVAEIADVYKKHIAYNKELDLINIKEEIGDLMFYVVNLCNINGWDMRDILSTNIAKLEARYPEKFTKERAIHRDIDVERGILERDLFKENLKKITEPHWNTSTTADIKKPTCEFCITNKGMTCNDCSTSNKPF